MKTLVLAAALLASPVAMAAEPTLNDMPSILQKLRGCSAGLMGMSCRIEAGKLWVSVDSDGGLTIFYRKYSSETIYASGKTVSDLLRDFAAKINTDRDNGKVMLDAIAPLLPTQ